MTSHEFAKLLLACPDVRVLSAENESSRFYVAVNTATPEEFAAALIPVRYNDIAKAWEIYHGKVTSSERAFII